MVDETDITLLRNQIRELVDLDLELNEEMHRLRSTITKLVELIKGLAKEAEEDGGED